VLATLALGFPFEVLHGVGHVQVSSGNSGFGERLVQGLSRRTYKWTTCPVFLIAWLLSDEHH